MPIHTMGRKPQRNEWKKQGMSLNKWQYISIQGKSYKPDTMDRAGWCKTTF